MSSGPTLSIRTTVLAAIALAVLLPVMIWWAAQLSLLRGLYLPIVAQNRQAVLGLTAAALVEPMWTIDEAATVATLSRALDDPSVRGVRLTEQRPGPNSQAIVHAYGQIGTPEARREVPVTREGESLGMLEVWFDSAQLDVLIDGHRGAALKLAALQIAVAALVLLLVLYRRLLAPIARLKAQATQLAQRGPVQAWDWPRPDELGQLGQHLNAVHAQVHELFGRLEQQQVALEQLALHDGLTGLPNRLLFRELLHNTVHQTLREGSTAALLFVDLDRFKTVNDTLGHAAGDALLREVARRLGTGLRAADMVCRHSGDEFLVLLPDVGPVDQVAALVERLQLELARPHLLEGREVEVGASIGIALCPSDAIEPDALVHHADLAMYEAKRLGRGRHSFFRAEFNEQVQAQMQLERELVTALRRGEFVLHYQPQVGANDGALHGCEALIRWRHPQLGLVAPGAFIATAEQCGLIGAIGSWALGEACAQIARWKAAGVAFGRVAVNVSAAEFRQQNLIETVQAAMQAHGVRPDELELEVTETVLMSDGDAALRVIAGLRALGLRIAVDDFGTGYSSLAYLKRLRPRTIKIDRSFLRDLPDDEEDRVVVLAILGLAQALGIEVVAEGVETEAQREFLRGARCEVLQGYLISRPVEAAAFEAWWRERAAAGRPDPRR